MTFQSLPNTYLPHFNRMNSLVMFTFPSGKTWTQPPVLSSSLRKFIVCWYTPSPRTTGITRPNWKNRDDDLLLKQTFLAPGTHRSLSLCNTCLQHSMSVDEEKVSMSAAARQKLGRGFRPGSTNTRLYSHRRWLEA